MAAVADEPVAVRFVIVAARRTGSNFLCSLLDSHPAVLCHHEIFNPKGIFYSLSLRNASFDLGSVAERDAAPAAFIERVWSHQQGHPCVGFKLTPDQAEAAFEHVLADSSVRKIVLGRRNRVKTCISERLAERLDQWEVYDEADLAPERPRVMIDVQDLRKHVVRNKHFYQHVETTLESTGQRWLHVDYEDLWDSAQRATLLHFLDAMPEDVELTPRSVKQNPPDARRLVKNFDELAEALRGDPLLDELLDRGD